MRNGSVFWQFVGMSDMDGARGRQQSGWKRLCRYLAGCSLCACCFTGCRTADPQAGQAQIAPQRSQLPFAGRSSADAERATQTAIQLATHEQGIRRQSAYDGEVTSSDSFIALTRPHVPVEHQEHAWELPMLESAVESDNPTLQRIQREVSAAWAKVRYSDKLPDPTLGADVFGVPMMGQRAMINVMQMIPWLDRLDAQAQEACYEAMALQQMYQAERINLIGELRANWAELYVLNRQVRILDANRLLLASLSELVNARIRQNQGSIGDVSLITVELGRIQEQHLAATQRIRSVTANLNRLAGRPSETPISPPTELPDQLPEWSHDLLRQLAWEHQPEIGAAQLRLSASRWGLEVAKLRRRPDLSVGASWYFMEQQAPPMGMSDGRDAWSLGAQVSIPLWKEKYDAIESEATNRHFASHSALEDLQLKYDAVLQDLWEQAKAARDTADLFRHTIIPQARQAFDADQQAYANGTVDLERLIQDVRNLLTLELSHDRAVSQQFIALVRIQQAVGRDLLTEQAAAPPVPAPAQQP